MEKNKAIIAHGIVAGLVMNLSWFGYNWIFVEEGEYDNGLGEIIGYATMVLGMGEVFMGIRKYRNKLDISFPFKEGFFLGLGMVLVASSVYAAGWMLYSGLIRPGYIELYFSSKIAALVESGGTSDEVDALKASTTQWLLWNENPFIKFGMTFMEIFPIGLVFSVITALILKRKLTEE